MLACAFFILIIILITGVIVGYPKSKVKQGLSKSSVILNKTSKVYKYKIVVDAGHGEWDPGTSSGKLYEKDITLKIAKYIEEYLKGKDCEVVMTRTADKVSTKTAMEQVNYVAVLSNEASPDAFVSIHVNSNEEPSCKGVSTCYYYNEANYQKEERLKLANIMQKQMIKDDNWKNMGIKKQKLVVLSKSTAVSALIECGFISNSEDRARLTNDEVLKRLAKNISEGVLEYLNGSKANKSEANNDK